MKFNCFPKKQQFFLIYSSHRVISSNLFNQLCIQSSPKNSVFTRFMKTRLGYIISSFIKYELDVPDEKSDFLGIVKEQHIVLFELANNIPIKVWRKEQNKLWIDEEFLGYQLISEYTFKEIKQKQKLIKKALMLQWDLVNKNQENIHGDLTHFNILVGKDNDIIFIDRKNLVNSKLFDFFYFYAYLKQSINICSTLSAKHKNMIVDIIEITLREVCQYNSFSDFEIDYNQILIPKKYGLLNENKEPYLKDFYKVFISDDKSIK